ncbi:MAG: hypothetical protein ACLUI7_01425 [Coprococcus sp.]
MLDYGKVTDTIYKRSVRKVIERNVPGAGDDRIGGRDILYFAADSDKAMLTAFATLTGNQLAAAGAVHLAVNRLAAAGAYALAVNIQLIVSAELPEKSIKALMGSVSESCGKLHITSVQADVAAVPGLTETVITATAIGEAGGLFEPEKAEADQDIIMAGYAGDYGAAKLAFAGQAELERHFNPVFLSPVMEADYTGDTIRLYQLSKRQRTGWKYVCLRRRRCLYSCMGTGGECRARSSYSAEGSTAQAGDSGDL